MHRAAASKQLAVRQQRHFIGITRREIEIVQYRDHAVALLSESAGMTQHTMLVGDVQAGFRFIQ